MVSDHHHVESDVGGAFCFLDSLGDRTDETEAEAEASGSSVHRISPGLVA
jgi:hypothetical protein